MKKLVLTSLVAATFSTAAIAQVTVYGLMDQAVRVTDGKHSQISGSYNTSRLGFKGKEDLGNGIAVSFVLEGKLDVSNGDMTGDQMFNRESSVSLGSETLGTITLGRTDTSDSEGIDTVAGFRNFGNFALVSNVEYAADRANTIRYTSPNIGGAKLRIGQSEASGSAEKLNSGSITFKNDLLSLGAGYDRTDSGNTYKAVAANIGLGVASVGAMYGQRDANVKTDVMAVSAKVALGPTYAAHGVYKTSEVEGNNKITTSAVGLTMTLSKRTFMHAVYQDTDKGASAGDFYQVGLVHKF